MSTPNADHNNKLPTSYIQSYNLKVLQGLYPVISHIIHCCGVASVYEIDDEIHDIDCRGPLFIVQTIHKELWMVVLNQSQYGTYRVEIDCNTQFQEKGRYLTLNTTNSQHSLVQFCFVAERPDDERAKTVQHIRQELSQKVQVEKILQQTVAYC
ncbi:2-alkenal reductase [Entamoeba marina]